MRQVHVLFVRSDLPEERVIALNFRDDTGKRSDYEIVYSVETKAGNDDSVICEWMFERCQNIEAHWSTPARRSMMTGDLVQIDERFYRVASVGWTDVTDLLAEVSNG